MKWSRAAVYDIIENHDNGNRIGYYVDVFIVTLIILNVLAVIAESVNWIYFEYKEVFYWFEIFSLAAFTLEYIVRLWCSPEGTKHLPDNLARIKWMRSPSAIIDLVAIAPSYLNFILPLDLRFLRILRLIRLLKLTRYFAALRILLKVIKREKSSFQAVLFILLIMIVVAASGIYLVEHKVQPDNFGSIPDSMWWAVVTLTTVGYGDVTPETGLGKFFGSVITILGIGVAALPAGILASGLADELAQRREMLEQKFREALIDGEIDFSQRRKISKLRKELGLSHEQAVEIVEQITRERRIKQREKALEESQKQAKALAEASRMAKQTEQSTAAVASTGGSDGTQNAVPLSPVTAQEIACPHCGTPISLNPQVKK